MDGELNLEPALDSWVMSASQTYPLMSEEQLKAFIAKAKDDQSIQDKLKAAKTTDDVVGIAKGHGHEFTADKITELSEDDLEGLAGGTASGTSGRTRVRAEAVEGVAGG